MIEQPKRRPPALAIVSLGLAAAFAGVVGWLLASEPDPGAEVSAALPRVEIALPPPIPGTAPEAAQEAAPEAVQQAAPEATPPPPATPLAAAPPASPEAAAPGDTPDTLARAGEGAPDEGGVGDQATAAAPSPSENERAEQERVAPLPPPATAPPDVTTTESAPQAPSPQAPATTAAPSVAVPAAPLPSQIETTQPTDKQPPAIQETARPAPIDRDERTALAVLPPRSPAPPPIDAPGLGITAPRGERLAPAPDPALIEPGPEGPLPIIGRDGREPWIVYARPFDLNNRQPKIAIVINGLGLSSAATEAAIQRLPGGITLSFAPFAENLEDWIRLARAAGHEVLLNLPMEPLNYPSNDPGPRTLLTSLPAAQNIDRLQWALSRVSGYVGVTNFMGSRFTTVPDAMQPVLGELKRRGLMFVDSRSSARSVAADIAREMRVPYAVNTRFIDNEASRAMIDVRLAEVERIAQREGFALAMGFPYPVTLERVAAWSATAAERGFILVPATAIARLARGDS